MLDLFATYQEARIFFLFEKKLFYETKNEKIPVFPNSDEYNNMYIILQY